MLIRRSATRILIAGAVRGAPGKDGRLNPEVVQDLRDAGVDVSGTPEQINQVTVDWLTEHGLGDWSPSMFQGGRGGSVLMEAPEIGTRLLQGGPAGHAGVAADGSTGGDVLVIADSSYAIEAEEYHGIMGGAAGAGGHGHHAIRGKGGNGGAGGSSIGATPEDLADPQWTTGMSLGYWNRFVAQRGVRP